MTEAGRLETLLELQAHDTRIDQIRHLMAALPAREERDAAAEAVAGVDAQIAANAEQRDELARDQKRLDDEVASLDDKRKGFDTKLYSGTVSNPRELQDLQEEIDALGRRISVLEDREIEIMEQVEPIEATLAELQVTADQRRIVLADAESRLTAAEAELAVELDSATAARAATAVGVDADLLAAYEKLRSGLGGIAVARLVGNQCGGCHLTLSAVEVARMRKLEAGEVAHCEECGRILVP